MWFKQIQLFQLKNPISFVPEELAEQFSALGFTSCFPSMPSSIGWVPPLDVDNAPLVHGINGYMMMCLQIEEKILPASVIRQELADKVKHLEITENRKMRHKEKLALKDEITLNLLPRAFSKFTKLYAYIDTRNHWLILGTNHAAKTEQFVSLFKRSTNNNINPLELKKLSPILTHWLKSRDYPTDFAIEKTCMMQDPNQQNRIIRCQQQDLFANSIQALIKEGCEAKQLALSWQDQVNFILADDFSLRNIQYQDTVLAAVKEFDSETVQQEFDADFVIMTDVLSGLLKNLISVFNNVSSKKETLEIA